MKKKHNRPKMTHYATAPFLATSNELLFSSCYEIKHPFADRHALNIFESGGDQDVILLTAGEMSGAGTDLVELIENSVVVHGISEIFQLIRVWKVQNE